MNTDQPLIITLFGATGDLAQKKIMPALLHLFADKKLSEQTKIIAFSRRNWTDRDYYNFITQALQQALDNSEENQNNSDELIKKFLHHVSYSQGTFDNSDAFKKLAEKIKNLDKEVEKESKKISQKIFYLAIQPEFYEQVSEQLAQVKLLQEPNKLLIEKPFGQDLHSAQELQKNLEKIISEEQIYRTDHYLGKLSIWDILETRKNNPELEARFNNKEVKTISAQMLENITINDRGEFYNSVGQVRDVVQNHVLEMLAAATLDIQKETISKARAEIFEALQPAKNIVRAQYEGYTEEQDVPKDSQTETYVKLETEINNKRWQGVPVILESGKALEKKQTTVTFNFKDGDNYFFDIEKNEKKDTKRVPDAYEIIIEKAIEGNKKYFVSLEEVLASWEFITPVIKKLPDLDLKKYHPGQRPPLL